MHQCLTFNEMAALNYDLFPNSASALLLAMLAGWL